MGMLSMIDEDEDEGVGCITAVLISHKSPVNPDKQIHDVAV